MKLNLLDFLLCPDCRAPLACVPFGMNSVEPDFGHFCRFWCGAKGLAVQGTAPADWSGVRWPAERLPFAKPAAIDREDCRVCQRHDVGEGVLICGRCDRIFPVVETIPELLPPELRNAERDKDFFDRFRDQMGARAEGIYESKQAGAASAAGASGAKDERKYKKAEMSLTRRADLPSGFFGPGLVVPFEPLHPIRSIEKILRFMVSVHHANLRFGDYVLDLGVGYAWTTEWLKKLGYSVIGVDINRDYLGVGLKRTGGRLPPLLVADVENLPLRGGRFHGVLFYDAFHHVADREACLRGCAEALMPGGLLIMAEPGPKHESHPASVQVMKTYGILEKGITEKELQKMIRGTAFEDVKKYPYDFGEVEILLLKKKGARVYTSKGPNLLSARIEPRFGRGDLKAGEPWPAALRVHNTGDTVWLHKTDDGVGEVRIGFQLKSAERVLLDENFHRVALPRDLAPGESADVETVLPPVAAPGDYILEIDGVSEGVIWFKDLAYNPVAVNLKVRP